MAKIGRPIKFVIRLTPEERTRLEGMIHCGIGALNSALKARILLKTDVSENGPGWSDERIAEALETSLSTVLRTRRQFVEEGLDAALSRKKSSWSPPRTFDGEAEANPFLKCQTDCADLLRASERPYPLDAAVVGKACGGIGNC